MRKKERLILAMGHIDEKYIKEANVRMHGGIMIKVAAVLLVMVLAVGLFLFIPYAPVTSNLKKYVKRLLLFAIISEIPFNLAMGSRVFYPIHQNILWSFLIAIGLIHWNEKVKEKQVWKRIL